MRHAPGRLALSTSFGFGGPNACLAFAAHDTREKGYRQP